MCIYVYIKYVCVYVYMCVYVCMLWIMILRFISEMRADELFFSEMLCFHIATFVKVPISRTAKMESLMDRLLSMEDRMERSKQ